LIWPVMAILSAVSHHLVYSIRIVVNAVGVWCGWPWDTTGSGVKALVRAVR